MSNNPTKRAYAAIKIALRLYADDHPKEPVPLSKLLQYACKRDDKVGNYLIYKKDAKLSPEANSRVKEVLKQLKDDPLVDIMKLKPYEFAWSVRDEALPPNENIKNSDPIISTDSLLKVLKQYLADPYQTKKEVADKLGIGVSKVIEALTAFDQKVIQLIGSVGVEEDQERLIQETFRSGDDSLTKNEYVTLNTIFLGLKDERDQLNLFLESGM